MLLLEEHLQVVFNKEVAGGIDIIPEQIPLLAQLVAFRI